MKIRGNGTRAVSCRIVSDIDTRIEQTWRSETRRAVSPYPCIGHVVSEGLRIMQLHVILCHVKKTVQTNTLFYTKNESL